MRLLRSLAGYTLLDHQKSAYIRQQLNMINLNEIIQKHKQDWCEHVRRMENIKIPKQILDYKPKGKRYIGRPKRRWIDGISFEDGTGK